MGYELWYEEGEPDQELWFAKFLVEREENYTLVVLRCLQVLGVEKGHEWIYNQGLYPLCEEFVEALSYWE